VQIIRAIYACRALTTPQIHTLFFVGPQENGSQRQPITTAVSTRCQRRLQLLYHHGYIHRDEQPQRLAEGRKPLVYLLDEKGARLLAQARRTEGAEIDWKKKDNRISPMFLEHLLATNDVRIAIQLAANRHGIALERWLDERTLKSSAMKDYVRTTWTDRGGRRQDERLAVVPDGYFALSHGPNRGHFFLEIDLATEPGKRWAHKVRAYLAYIQSGLYQKRYQTRSLRVLTVTTGPKRLANLIRSTEALGGGALFWFTTLGEASARAVLHLPIWRRAKHEGVHALLGNVGERS
jgi:hypothetical protein